MSDATLADLEGALLGFADWNAELRFMTDRGKKPLSEQFRTLDEPAPRIQHDVRQVVMTNAQPWSPPAGFWETDASYTPSAWQRFWARVLLGWNWRPFDH